MIGGRAEARPSKKKQCGFEEPSPLEGHALSWLHVMIGGRAGARPSKNYMNTPAQGAEHSGQIPFKRLSLPMLYPLRSISVVPQA